MNPVLDAIQAQRSIRRYLDRPVPAALLDQLIDSARWVGPAVALIAAAPPEEALALLPFFPLGIPTLLKARAEIQTCVVLGWAL